MNRERTSPPFFLAFPRSFGAAIGDQVIYNADTLYGVWLHHRLDGGDSMGKRLERHNAIFDANNESATFRHIHLRTDIGGNDYPSIFPHYDMVDDIWFYRKHVLYNHFGRYGMDSQKRSRWQYAFNPKTGHC